MVSIGLVWPSLGMNSAPTTSAVSNCGQRRARSFGVNTSQTSPKFCAIAALRRSSVQRASLVAMLIEPFCFSPVGWPDSASSPLKSCAV